MLFWHSYCSVIRRRSLGVLGDALHSNVRVEGSVRQPAIPSLNLTQAFKDLVQIGINLTSEQNLATLLERILTEARRFTRAEAGTLFLREGDQLRFSVVQNDKLVRELGLEEMPRRLQAEPLNIRELSLAGHVALTGATLNLHHPYTIP